MRTGLVVLVFTVSFQWTEKPESLVESHSQSCLTELAVGSQKELEVRRHCHARHVGGQVETGLRTCVHRFLTHAEPISTASVDLSKFFATGKVAPVGVSGDLNLLNGCAFYAATWCTTR